MSGAGADPEFPIGGGGNPPWGAPTYDFAKFCEKLHEIDKILGHRAAHAGHAPLNLPLWGYVHLHSLKVDPIRDSGPGNILKFLT